jgi:hypothetical protein
MRRRLLALSLVSACSTAPVSDPGQTQQGNESLGIAKFDIQATASELTIRGVRPDGKENSRLYLTKDGDVITKLTLQVGEHMVQLDGPGQLEGDQPMILPVPQLRVAHQAFMLDPHVVEALSRYQIQVDGEISTTIEKPPVEVPYWACEAYPPTSGDCCQYDTQVAGGGGCCAAYASQIFYQSGEHSIRERVCPYACFNGSYIPNGVISCGSCPGGCPTCVSGTCRTSAYCGMQTGAGGCNGGTSGGCWIWYLTAQQGPLIYDYGDSCGYSACSTYGTTCGSHFDCCSGNCDFFGTGTCQ